MLKEFFADLHIHIGGASDGSPVKITASAKLNFPNILAEAAFKKGLDLIGIIDCASPVVLKDIEEMLAKGEMKELKKGGILYKDSLLVLLGAEIESREENGGQVHYMAFFPKIKNIKAFSSTMDNYISNITLSSQAAALTGKEILKIVSFHGGILIPAHIFTPHKSFYGRAFQSYTELFSTAEWEEIPAVELGLSADTKMADLLPELQAKSFLSNSDAHSLPKIAREYNIFQMEELNYKEFIKVLKREEGRKISKNYGLNPELGKYHRSFCEKCKRVFTQPEAVLSCPSCGKEKLVLGVKDRILAIAPQKEAQSPAHRPQYIYQVPLLDIPGIGKKTIQKILANCGSEMDVLHKISSEKLKSCLSSRIYKKIAKARKKEFSFQSGGGGKYGKVIF
ncbi:endonuclease Q family protein [Halanaerobium sp. Z-7514]|uniref:Endonuclease Q family protein n=1 Tax=Halanaerobium polyolivorans TaxID=2886943 RepID=A0AAW4WY76_9FIRM|nr:endonuclease Q family protein [Halanaerobium polyolivorans]MCC3143782.1 endonuclease Q family protein [Halanaerobium polyolivorans]